MHFFLCLRRFEIPFFILNSKFQTFIKSHVEKDFLEHYLYLTFKHYDSKPKIKKKRKKILITRAKHV